MTVLANTMDRSVLKGLIAPSIQDKEHLVCGYRIRASPDHEREQSISASGEAERSLIRAIVLTKGRQNLCNSLMGVQYLFVPPSPVGVRTELWFLLHPSISFLRTGIFFMARYSPISRFPVDRQTRIITRTKNILVIFWVRHVMTTYITFTVCFITAGCIIH
jgi:hypothetical protein